MIRLAEVTQSNYAAVIALSHTLSAHDRLKVADNVNSLAEAYVYDYARPKAIYSNDTLVGFLMLGLDDFLADKEDTPTLFIWRLMIAQPYQHKGFGKAVLQEVKAYAKEINKRIVHVFVKHEDEMPMQFYLKNGFVSTSRIYGDELLLKYRIEA